MATVAPVNFNLGRPPQTDDELWELVYTLWGIRIPRTQVCTDHVPPFRAFADAYFARYPVIVIKGSRGFAGKSRTLASLTLTEAVVMGAEASILGGSFEQSKNVHEAMREMWDYPLAPKHMIVQDTSSELRLSNKAKVRPLTASQKTVRGPHPQRLRLDEIDEMDLEILDAAMGQPMPKRGIETQTVMSSTHQYAEGTFTEILLRAAEHNWPVYSWCWRETSNPVDGWLAPETVERKKNEVSIEMFRVEYDLGEPSVGNRAMATEAVDDMFSLGEEVYQTEGIRKGAKEDYVFEKPHKHGEYVTSADWAQENDYTVISTFRVDCKPWRLVRYIRLNRRPYPVMIGLFNDVLRDYGGRAIHDATGLGNVVKDYIDQKARNFVMSGRARDDMLTEYISAVERGELRCPRVATAYSAHKYASVEDVYAKGKEHHLPDEICAFALAWHAAGQKKHVRALPVNIMRDMGMPDEQAYEVEREPRPQSPWRDVGGKITPASTGFNFDLSI